MLEPAVRVPLIVRHPDRFAPGRRCSTPVSLLDLFPTFCATSGQPIRIPGEDSADLADIAAGRIARTHVLSHFSQRALGLYLAVERDWKYIYSAADDREWLFDLRGEAREATNRAGDPACQRDFERMKRHLLDRFERDHYDRACKGGDWRRYPRTTLPVDPDAGLLVQDPAALTHLLASLDDYAGVTPSVNDSTNGTHAMSVDKLPRG
jgi:arylsulfatase A-like enzyme